MNIKEMNQIMEWHQQGKLQYRLSATNDWQDYNEGQSPFIWYPKDCFSNYRIKPEPTLRAWRPEEVPVGALIRGECKTNLYWKEHLITGRFGAWVYFANEERTTEYLLNQDYTYSLDHGKTWLPCGVME